jgi:hypothetical protein
MNTVQLNNLIIKDSMVERYRGIFAIDTLPTSHSNGIYVVNTSPAHIPVGHWVGIFDGTFFCSFGVPPEVYGISNLHSYNTQKLQCINSSVCGYYVLTFVKLMSRGYTLHDMLGIFTGDCSVNDDILRTYYSIKE